MKFRYLLIVFLLNFFLTNFVFTKKSLAADACGDAAFLCSTSNNASVTNGTVRNVTGIVYEFRGLDSIFTNNANITGTTAGVSLMANNGLLNNNAEILANIGVRFGASGSTTTGGIINNNSGGTISGNSSSGVYLYGTSSTATINNSGTIQGTGSSAYAISNEGTLTINNETTGTIKSTLYRSAINNSRALTINNSGTISSTSSSGADWEGTIYHWGTSFNLTNESGGIIVSNTPSSPAIVIESGTASIINRGNIQATGSGIDAHGIFNQTTNITIENYGSITSASGKGIVNRDLWGTVGTLKNAQTGLTYNGYLPQNYKIILGANASTFGTLIVTNADYYNAVTGGTGKTTFGIDSGTVKASKYAGVITGVSNSYLSPTTGTYGGYDWSLSLQSGSSTTWDLLFASYVEGPSSADTNVSLSALASHLKGAINYQNSSLNQSLNYDCSYFGKNNFCMSGGVRNTNTRDNDSQSAVLVAAAKINDRLRVGGYIDEVVSDNFNSNMKLSSNIPILGVFAKYNEHGDFGLKASLSAGYVDQDVKSTRTVSGTSEPGSGTSSLDTTGIQAEIKYGISHSSFLTVSPYVGYRNTQTTRDRYTEQTSSSVTTPLTYNKIKQKEETAFAGIELKSHFYTTDSFATLNLGCEHTTKFSVDNLSTAGVSGTSDINLGSSVDKNRPILTASFNKDLNEAGRLSLNFDRRQQAYSPTHSTNATIQYIVGF